jgi:hypothetical protein
MTERGGGALLAVTGVSSIEYAGVLPWFCLGDTVGEDAAVLR